MGRSAVVPLAETNRVENLQSPMLDHAECVTWDAETLTPPVCTRYLVNEATIEKVHVILKENPQGVLYLRDELSGWMVQLEQRGRERDRAFLLETWDGNGDSTFDRLGRGTVYASHMCLYTYSTQDTFASLPAILSADSIAEQRFCVPSRHSH